MWYRLLKLLFQITLFFIWTFTLIYLIFLSILVFILFNICLTIFLFWFILTLIGWSIALIPILIFVFIPWYRRQCRLWTINNRQSRLSVAFFHPYCNHTSGRERILWSTIESILKRYKNDIQIIIYTGNINIESEENIFQHIHQNFDISIEDYKSSITFVYLRSQFLLEEKYYKICNLWGRSIGSIIVGFEALIRFIPDIYIDSTGYAFTYPCFYYFASIPIISYIHNPTITNDQLAQINEQYRTDKSFINLIELLYYRIFGYIYGWCGRCSNIVCCNSSWTKHHIKSIWKSNSTYLLYPPCDVTQSLEIPFMNENKKIISLGQFRLEKNHELQIRAFYELLQRKNEYQQQLKLILIGSIRHNEDQEYVKQLQILVNDLNLMDNIEFKFNISFTELKSELNQAIIGLHTMRNESFGIGIVEMMAAGTIVVAHKSAGPKMDIIDEGHTGFLAANIDSYATKMQQILEMSTDEHRQMQEEAYLNMASKVIGKCEKDFIIQCLRDRQRLDHRLPFVTRDVKIDFREEYGSVTVSLGLTKVLAHTSCKVVKPKETRANEGRLRLQLKNSHTMMFNFETGRQAQWTTLMSRQLLQNIRDSGCVDMESLCILAHEHVWEISVNLHVLDYDGNILDCANLAALCALAHFRYPAVTVIGTDVHVHSTTERNPQPIRILHFPIIISFALFQNGEHMLIDACEAEEKVMEGLFAVGMNQHKELSTLTMLGEICLSRDQVQNCISLAHHLVLEITKQIRASLEKNREEQLKLIQAINHR
ncbi:unnamed protein product [Adineta steineri]|uniref:Exosome complex component RRP45 n=1 Tax=Adineta steineri TaxID=433720 RepID=A0A818PMQ3_9BILA|nr:unnamed protein product [Adineta steineri]